MHLGPFGCLTKLGAKRAELVQKFVPQSRVGIFHNKLCRSTPLDRKLTFWCVLYYLDAFGTLWLPYKMQYKTGRTCAIVCATKSRHNFSQRTHLIDPVSYYLGAFGTVWMPYKTRVKMSRSGEKVCATKLHRNFSQRTQPIQPIGL